MTEAPPLSRDLPGPALEAMFEAMFLVAFADDDFSDEERERFRRRVSELSGGFVEGERFEGLLAQVTREFFTDGLARRLSTLVSRLQPEKYRRIAFQTAAEVARQDELTPRERRLLEELGAALELDADVIRATLGERASATTV